MPWLYHERVNLTITGKDMWYTESILLSTMAEKKTKKQEQGWTTLLFGSVVNSLSGTLQDMLARFQARTKAWTQRLLRHMGLFFFSLLGTVLLVVGIARLLDGFYGKPGMGEVVVGGSILCVAILLYFLDQNDDNSKV